MKKFILCLFLIAVAAITFFGYSNVYNFALEAINSNVKQASSSNTVAAEKSAEKPPIQILFIGNSYTFVNDLPKMLEKLAESDPDNKFKFVTASVTKGGAHFTDLWNEGNAAKAIKGKRWDYVVLQNQSGWAMYPEYIEKANIAGAKFADIIRKSGGKILLYQTWARQPGSSWYTDPKTASVLENPDYMQSQLHSQNNILAKAINAEVVPVGDVWLYATKHNKTLNLYDSDGSHPSVEGTYLAALLFYRQISGNDGKHVNFVPQGGNPSAIADIKSMIALAK